MATKSAKSGTATWEAAAIPGVFDIQVSDIVEEQVFASSGTAGAKHRVAGLADVTGSFKCYTDPGMSVGATGTLVLTSDGSETLYNGEAYISDISTSVPIGTGGLVEFTVTWGAAPGES